LRTVFDGFHPYGFNYPADRKAMDESIQVLEEAVKNAKLGEKERLRRFIPPDART